jgi:hypothetical protein
MAGETFLLCPCELGVTESLEHNSWAFGLRIGGEMDGVPCRNQAVATKAIVVAWFLWSSYMVPRQIRPLYIEMCPVTTRFSPSIRNWPFPPAPCWQLRRVTRHE